MGTMKGCPLCHASLAKEPTLNLNPESDPVHLDESPARWGVS